MSTFGALCLGGITIPGCVTGHICEVVACASPSTVTLVAPGVGTSEVALVAKDAVVGNVGTPLGRGVITVVITAVPAAGHAATTGPSKPALIPLHKVPVTHCTVSVAAAVSSSTRGASYLMEAAVVVQVRPGANKVNFGYLQGGWDPPCS